MAEGFKIVYEGGQAEIEEKKSRFIAYVQPADTEEAASEFIEKIKKMNWNATHNCVAAAVGRNNEFTRCSDDGEPGGTAGKPMLEVLLGEGIHNAVVVVTRYFGGTLLGTGGLVRAYQRAVKAGLEACKIIEKRQGARIVIRTDYNGIGKLQYIAAGMGLFVADTIYGADVVMEVMVQEEDIKAFADRVTESTAGKAVLEIGDIVSYGIEGNTLVM